MEALTHITRGLVRHHIATPEQPLPAAAPGITWIWAANGIFKRGIAGALDLCIPVGLVAPVPGLAPLGAHVRWYGIPLQHIPGVLLEPILRHAQRASNGSSIHYPIEQQYFITWRDDCPEKPLRVAVPRQKASSGRVEYEMNVRGQVLIDIHSHHHMQAYFSATDDRDDTGLSLSAVIGTIYTKPRLVLRANVYGHHYDIPPCMVFDRLGPFEVGDLNARSLAEFEQIIEELDANTLD
jgi:PRTRC genetic system protein A